MAAPSRILFAVALTTDENNNPPGEVESGYSSIAGNEDNPPSNNRYSSIAGSDWETLDLGDIEIYLAARLSDDDLSSVLQHIDAVHKLKRLWVTNCINIRGAGLEPLRGSTIIEQIDLSLTAIGDPARDILPYQPFISCDLVLPILDSIIAAEGCSLKHLQFPYKWRRDRDRSTDSDFHAFIVRYNDMRRSRDTITCLNCNEDLPPDGSRWITNVDDEYYGLHGFTCFQCLKHYCYDCDGPDLTCCCKCDRDYCKDCVRVDECAKCDDFACEHCSKTCDECNETICSECVENDSFHGCSYCGVSYCKDCNNHKIAENPIRF